jgi:hypothetical protein
MTYLVDPMPEMVSQRLIANFLPVIDPTCGRYCLKALLKYLYEKHKGVRLKDIILPKPASRLSDWMAYDPIADFQLGEKLLRASSVKPENPAGWTALLKERGPIILQGTGLGQAGFLGHFILLVGMTEGAAAQFHFKDPLAGDDVGTADYARMNPKIDIPLIFAKWDIGAEFARLVELRSDNIGNLPFNG